MPKNYWMVKQEPDTYAWSDFLKDGRTDWTGVRNFQARNNLRLMKTGDVVFFYHSTTEKQAVGVATVAKEHYPDPTADEGDWSAVDLKPLKTLASPVTLAQMKANETLREMPLIRQTQLSVMALTEGQAKEMLKLARTTL